jgi:hypothetical protein
VQNLPITPEEVRFFKELNKNKVPFIIVGLASAVLQGAPIVTKDVDVWFRNIDDPRLQDVVKKCGAIFVASDGSNPPVLAGKGFEEIDIVTHVHGVSEFDEEYKKCGKVKIADITFRLLSLESIIKSKRYLNREKDLMVLPALKDALVAIEGKRRSRK